MANKWLPNVEKVGPRYAVSCKIDILKCTSDPPEGVTQNEVTKNGITFGEMSKGWSFNMHLVP